MSGAHHAAGDDVAQAALAFVRAARVAAAHLRDDAVPALPPLRRMQAEDVARRLMGTSRPSERLLDDLDACAAMLARETETGTHHGWEADEHHVRGGWPTVHRTPDAAALDAGRRRVEAARDALAELLDAERAAAIVAAA